MSQLETNLFPITNLSELRSRYRLFRIRGLSADQDEYDPNIQILIRKLSYAMRTPVAVIAQNGEPHLVLQEDAPEPQSPYPLVRATAVFERTDRILTLDYESPAPGTEALRVRFLQFAIEGVLFHNPIFWQPSAGNPFFERQPVLEREGVCVYRGYAARVVAFEEGKLGVCVDVQHKYVSRIPLAVDLRREDFRRYKNTRSVYRYGNSWYEIRLHDHTGLSVSEQMITVPTAARSISLLEYIMDNAPKPLPREVIDLPATSPAVKYMTGRGEVRYAAAALCYPVFDTSDPRIGRIHRKTILSPSDRRGHILTFLKKHLTSIRFKGMTVRVSPEPVVVPARVFLPPDLAFGHGTVFSVRGTPGATYVGLNQLGRTRLNALFNRGVGPHATKPLDRQYLILPKSVSDSHGSAFLKDLRAVMGELYPQELGYDPTRIVYSDLGPKTYAEQARAILAAVEAEPREPGYGMVMIHETVDRKNREHDQLAAMVMRELRERGLYVSIIHTAVGKECYQLPQNAPAGTDYRPVGEKRGKLSGYLRNIAITKVLLTNECWPFVLATPLHADLTIALDVQLNTACFALIGRCGADVRTVQRTSTQKERLSRSQVRQTILEVIRQEVSLGRKDVHSIVVQRDGRLFATEIAGIKDAVRVLQGDGVLPADASLSFVEIPKRSAVPFRLFDVAALPSGRQLAGNPQIGAYYIPSSNDGYVCTTGREFRHPGTTNPLHIKYIEGAMPFHEILEDIYALTCLAWTRPEDCTRYPITLKLADIRLREHAGGYDEDALEYGGELVPQEAEANE